MSEGSLSVATGPLRRLDVGGGGLHGWLELLAAWLPALVTLGLAVGAFTLVRWLLIGRRAQVDPERHVHRQLVLVLGVGVGVIAVVLSLPLGDEARGQLLGLMGLLISAMIALASTTFVGNAMAGLMLQAVRNFRPGDFLQVGEHFGRVTVRGLLHTELQSEDRDLTTFPNLYLVTHPVKVVRYDGTIISASVSLGYDVARQRVESCLKEAATEAGLQEPFVQVRDLGDFSVGYRIAGFLPKVEHLISARSTLRKLMLDKLHGARVEIVSPEFVNRRAVPPAKVFIPAHRPGIDEERDLDELPESIMFDKADAAAEKERVRDVLVRIEGHLKRCRGELDAASSPEVAARAEGKIKRLERRREVLTERLDQD